ncbi:MAG: hypothetical protein WAO78_14430 [Roseovarius sp.]
MIPIRLFESAAALALASVLLAGCAEGMPQILQPPAAQTEQLGAPQAAPSVTRPLQAESAAMGAPAPLAVSATYFERILVPIGSELTLRAEAASGVPVITRIKTTGGPPYDISASVPSMPEGYPMTVTATLNSTIGHVLSGSVVLDAVPISVVEIVMRMQVR